VFGFLKCILLITASSASTHNVKYTLGSNPGLTVKLTVSAPDLPVDPLHIYLWIRSMYTCGSAPDVPVDPLQNCLLEQRRGQFELLLLRTYVWWYAFVRANTDECRTPLILKMAARK
jgi:hypothetical protein